MIIRYLDPWGKPEKHNHSTQYGPASASLKFT